ncbi:elongation factor 1-gamma-like isoform X3 [Conger conger]|uniref:elongation factor 1-gamma-like isoform X3 n=1 Tax=Conger conger TaxID=82655 RepID=UPI002A5AF2A7|nr:elongation factor 1-gamma-like isoform X3 [Conger conger]
MATLYSPPDFWRSYPILISAQYSGAQITMVPSLPDFKGEDSQETDHLSKFPFRKVPAFEENGFQIQEATAIANYVAGDVLRGAGPQDQALVQQWVNLAEGEIIPSMTTWVYPIMGVAAYSDKACEKAKEVLLGVLSVLNQHLLPRTFLVGDTVTLADISVACALLLLFTQVMEPSMRQLYLNVTRWFCTCVHQPQFRTVLGDVILCKTASPGKLDGKPASTEIIKNQQQEVRSLSEVEVQQVEVHKQQEGVQQEGVQQVEQQQQEQQVEQQQEQQQQQQEDGLDPTEEAVAAEPKAKDPFASLPKSTFVLDEFKRTYSNEDTLTVALPYLWKKLDREGWSLWYSEYKYPSELGQVFMSCNLITGMFQRLDRLRKHAFASIALLGTDGDSSISGVWLLRGQQLAFELCEDWQADYESYSWRKLDPESEETCTLVREYLSWQGDFKHVGKSFNQAKIFK